MCNELHMEKESDPRPIPSFGIGYKLFTKRGEELYPLAVQFSTNIYLKTDSRIEWTENRWRVSGSYGFCFFTNLKEAKRCMYAWKTSQCYNGDTIVLRKIKYGLGLGSCLETNILNGIIPFRIALCKWFKVLLD